ncbi:acetate kinase [Demequina capsici]|uniref:Acetate kinase n=1 Tax=Demequina capsici TaxID=3075620 RepID=A0AA96JCU3_9MICO|nr:MULTISPECIES: acetate kinase [unclassified Demequina]WNM23984.1 acetate kinase [Demequina sp. OYTSA14]WNM26812.1 acetate kinase [Demequina sp. PMTSA13]
MAVNYEGIALVLNCGSSSVKYQVVDTTKEEPLASGLVERVTDHAVAIQEIIATLGEPGSGVNLADLTVVGHRVVQGGEEFSAPTIVDDEVERGIAKLSVLAPLHNPGHVAGISAARAAFPNIPHVTVFDTAFHTTLPEEAYTYPLDIRVAKEHGIRKYGFHGTSHGYVSREAARLMGKEPKDINVITLHLGNGASADAVQGGRAVDTSMGLTPLDGLMMGSRTGTIDPAVVFHLHRAAGMSIDEIDTLFNKQSGLLGMCGYSDLRDVHKAIEAGSHEARLALSVYTRRIKMFVGQYLAVMGSVDAIVFTAGVGENDDIVRLESMQGLEGLGIVIDEERNAGRKKTGTLVSADDSKVQIWVIPTNEEREIALQSIAAVS